MRNVKNMIVKKMAMLALAVAGIGFTSSQASAQDVQCDSTPTNYTCIQPVIQVRQARSHSNINPNALRERMERVGTRIQADLSSTPQWTDANVQLQQATADVETAENRIEQTLSVRPDYQAAMAQKQAAEDLVASLRQSGADIEQITAAAENALEAGKTLTQLQVQASANDPQLIDARARLQEASALRQGMQAGLRDQVLNDPQFQHASRRLDRLQ